jgi:hypothetical protein
MNKTFSDRLRLIVLLCLSAAAHSREKTYQTGTLVDIKVQHHEFAPLGAAPIDWISYKLQIDSAGHHYVFLLVPPANYQLEWKVNDPIEFRLQSDKMFIRRPNGKEFHMTLSTPPPEDVARIKARAEAKLDALRNGTGTSADSRCEALVQSSSELAPLKQTCIFALQSRKRLPDFVCQETTQHFAGNSQHEKWKSTDVVDAVVTVERGHETYSNVVVNGKPLDVPPNARSGKAFSQYLISTGQRGFWDLTQFGTTLGMLFGEENQTSFKSAAESTNAEINGIQFDFEVKLKYSPFKFAWGESRMLQDGTVKGEQRIIPYGAVGSIWLDAATGRLLRFSLNATDLPKDSPITSSSRVTNYDMVSIGEAGQFLLPVSSEGIQCSKDEHRCDRDLLDFHECRKFGAESNIVPE